MRTRTHARSVINNLRAPIDFRARRSARSAHENPNARQKTVLVCYEVTTATGLLTGDAIVRIDSLSPECLQRARDLLKRKPIDEGLCLTGEMVFRSLTLLDA